MCCKKNKKTIKALCFLLLTVLSITGMKTLLPIDIIHAGAAYHQIPDIDKPAPINFLNGSFEQPDIDTDFYEDNMYTTSTSLILPHYNFYHQDRVNGWNTIPVSPTNYEKPYAYYIEIQEAEARHNVHHSAYIQFAQKAADKYQYAELNSEYPGRFYQVAETTPGTRVYWQFAHSARKTSRGIATGIDTLNFYLRPAGTPDVAPSGAHLICTAATDGEGNGTVSGASNPVSVTKAGEWSFYRGAYKVPSGQTSTEFSYESVTTSSGGARGNFLDAIKFQTGSKLIAEKSILGGDGRRIEGGTALIGEIVTVKVDITNWGETDASRCVFSDILDDHLEYIPDSAELDGVDAGTKAVYDSGTDELKINFGTGATAGNEVSNGGILSGSQTMGTNTTTLKGETVTITFKARVNGSVGTVVKNQAKVTYNDKDYEAYNPDNISDFSYVQGKTVEAGDEATYINQFEIVNRSIAGNGTVWIDSNEDGNIGTSGERLISGAEVKVVDSATGAQAEDINGNPLVTNTDSNGNYSFRSLTQGSYKILMEVPPGYRVTSKADPVIIVSNATLSTQTTPNNNAKQNGTKAEIGPIDLSNDFTFEYKEYTANNLDIGFVPQTDIAKTAKVDGGNEEEGTQEDPVTVELNQSLDYLITIENHATNVADTIDKALTITDVIPAGLTVTGTNPPADSAVDDPGGSGGTLVTWNIPSPIAVGKTIFTIYTTVYQGSSEFVNTAKVKQGADGSEEETNNTYHKSNGISFIFYKVDENGDSLQGAEFEFYACTHTHTIDCEGLTDPSKCNHVHSPATDNTAGNCWDVGNPLQAVSEAGGRVEFPLLNTGDYILRETKSINGYQIPAGQWLIHVDTTAGIFTITGRGDPLPPAFYTEEVDDGNGGSKEVYKLPNYPNYTPPFTGGSGTILFTVGGIVLIGAAVILIIITKKK